MRMKKKSSTESLCPICMKKVDAHIEADGKCAFMIKNCSEHGSFKTIVWKGSIPMEQWIRKKERATIQNPMTPTEKGCPFDCGLCKEHRQHTCTALIEVTKNCNLHCRYCFADSVTSQEADPTFEEIRFQYESIINASGHCNIQLSGGEPTVRNDLPQIVEIGTTLGFKFIQLNTNGIRLAEDQNYVKMLKEAGLTSVFLQFDGTKDSIYKELRGRELLETKIKAIEHCKAYGIGVVLVPTLVPGVNVDNIGELIDFAIEHAPTVRGVHFQPVSYFGRVPFAPQDTNRITLAEVMDEIDRQTFGKISLESLKPPGCENALCSFHGNYMIEGKMKLMTLTSRSNCCGESESAEVGANKAKAFVARNWSNKATQQLSDKMNEDKISDWDKILYQIQNNTFSISAMAFQDVWNVDLERVKDCCIHVATGEGKLIPFCLYNITDSEGRYLYRN